MELSTPLRYTIGIGPLMAKRLERLELFTVEDLIHHYPFRYQDFSKVASVPEVKEGEEITIKGQIWSITNTYTRFRRVLTKAILNDGTGSIELVWFNQSWLTKSIGTGDYLQISGKVKRKGSKVTIMMPQWEKILNPDDKNTDTKHTGRLVPVYPETYGVTSKWLRTKIADLLPLVLDKVQDPLPDEIRDSLIDLPQALQQIHYPQDFQLAQKAKDRLSFDELFFIQLATLFKRSQWQKKTLIKPWKIDQEKIDEFIKNLPFELTPAQQKVIGDILEDLQREKPMNRLVQGDVGSGKTVVAAVISYISFLNGFQTLYMAPTEILAFQHHKTLNNLLNPYGIEVGIYTGSRKEVHGSEFMVHSKKTKQTKNHQPITNNPPHIIVGTHALLSDKLTAENVGLIIVDEQQRFGVEQRTKLRTKAHLPHF